MLRSLIVVLVFALILLPACNKNVEVEVEIPVWAEVQALLPSDVVGEECSLEPPEGKPAVAFFDEKGTLFLTGNNNLYQLGEKYQSFKNTYSFSNFTQA